MLPVTGGDLEHVQMKFPLLIFLVPLFASCDRRERVVSEHRNSVSSIDSEAANSEVTADSSPRDLPQGWIESGVCIVVARLSADHSEKMNRASVLVGNVAYLFRGDYQRFKEEDIGKRIKVSGVMEEGRLPMFIASEGYEGLARAGIPMPPGTNLEEKSRYYYIKDPVWEVIGEPEE